MKTQTCTCQECNKPFEAPLRDLKRGRAKFCSLHCSSKFNGRIRVKPAANVICAMCAKPFYINNSKRAKSKSGLYFCCRAHKDAAQRIGGITQIQPPHYGTGNGTNDYRTRAINKYGPVCNRCGYHDNIAAITVHHKDRNRQNPAIENLEVLCANCHAIEHWAVQNLGHETARGGRLPCK